MEGRCIAVGMMICGIALVGTVTATIASWLVERVTSEEEAGQAATTAHIQLLADKIDRLEGLLSQAAADGQPRGTSRGEIVT
jgi:voltage-gated potassium channel